MNPEIHTIVEDMKKRSKKEPIAESDIHTYQLAQMAHLLSLLAEETETQSQKVIDYSKKIVIFTKVLLWFTGVLVFIGLVQIFMMIFKS
jgi:hypothetical protein